MDRDYLTKLLGRDIVALVQDVETLRKVVDILLEWEHPATIIVWLRGMNELLDDESPLLTIDKDPKAVISAARNFAAYG